MAPTIGMALVNVLSNKVTDVPLNIDYQDVVDMARLEGGNDYFCEYILDWSIESDDYLSWFEKSQFEFDGDITSKEPTIEYSELNGAYA